MFATLDPRRRHSACAKRGAKKVWWWWQPMAEENRGPGIRGEGRCGVRGTGVWGVGDTGCGWDNAGSRRVRRMARQKYPKLETSSSSWIPLSVDRARPMGVTRGPISHCATGGHLVGRSNVSRLVVSGMGIGSGGYSERHPGSSTTPRKRVQPLAAKKSCCWLILQPHTPL